MPEAIIFFFLSQSFTDFSSQSSWLHQCTCTHRKFATMMIYSVFSLYVSKLFCDRRAYAYTRSMWRRVSSNLVRMCPWMHIKKCTWVLSISSSIDVLLSLIFFLRQIIKRNWLLYCLLLFMQIRKKEDDCNVHRRMLIIFVNSSRGVALIHSSKWNRNQPMNNLIERHTSRWRKKKMQHDILTEVHSSSSTSYRYRNKLFVDGHSSYNSSMCVTAGTHPDYMEEKKAHVRIYINGNNLFSRSWKKPVASNTKQVRSSSTLYSNKAVCRQMLFSLY
jgi:hypothetical protein